MPVTFHIPGALREFTGGRSEVDISGTPGTVADAFSALWSTYPGLRDRMATEQGEIREHINVFVGDELIRYTGGLATRVVDGARITILPAVSGGGPDVPIEDDARELLASEYAKFFTVAEIVITNLVTQQIRHIIARRLLLPSLRFISL